jgi:cell division protein ZapA
MSELNNPPIKVQILGKEYPISCPTEEQHDLLIAARYLDEKMRHIRDTGRVIGTERIAVMAALNIAHELLQANQQNKRLAQDLRTRIGAGSHEHAEGSAEAE